MSSGLPAGITEAVSVVVHPLAPGIAMDLAPRESIFAVSPVPLFVVVVVYQTQSFAAGVKDGDVEQDCAVPDPEESAH
jgi:hypothetical protein